MIIAIYRLGYGKVFDGDLRTLKIYGDEVAPERCDNEAARLWGSGRRRVARWVRASNFNMITRRMTPYVFYMIGSICFLVGTAIAMWQAWKGQG